jgi:uncharacterized repeat protein (TIGR03803 family)
VNCRDGGDLVAGLALGSDGNLYGTTYGGGVFSNGTVFKITRTGALTTLHNFNTTNGEGPHAVLVQGTDGKLYGTTAFGGDHSRPCQPYGCGTAFAITRSGKLITLHSFLPMDGDHPWGGIVQATDGNFYGTGSSGGAFQAGTVFKVSVGLSPFVKTLPTIGKVGTKVRILGNNLTGAISVTFHGTPANFAVVSGTQITTSIPTGATSGTVEVTTSNGILKSNAVFHVVQ